MNKEIISNLIKQKLPIINKKMSDAQFGKRNYIGASDISKCERQFILSKLSPQEFSTNTLIQFYRGHIAEMLLKDVFNETQYKYKYQEQIEYNEFFKATIDFMFYTKDYSKIGIVECKTVSSIPEKPHENWILQLQAQMGIVKQKYPNAEIKGSILCLNLNTGELREFNSFEPNEILFKTIVEKAERLWRLWQNKDIENAKPEKSVLCGYCQYRSDCPAFKKDNTDDIPSDIEELALEYIELRNKKEEIEKKEKYIKQKIFTFANNENFHAETKKIIVKVIKSTDSWRVDSKKLQKEYPEIYEKCKKLVKGSLRLQISEKKQ
ncbi:PD-(D/E)XK nuclease family protein [Deferribacter abyssi]|uniref:PD-(D/E)XK nuclease family protein n=1 Tax=Deferribacter abyssi TaxID=213806 RepID=UPI003C144427